MPELAEVKLTSDYINQFMKLDYYKIEKNPIHKGSNIKIQFKEFKIFSISRGKELLLYLINMEDAGVTPILMTMGMSGHFEFTKTGDESKHAHLKFYTKDGYTLSFVDVRRFGKWKQLKIIDKKLNNNIEVVPFSVSRGPDPSFEHDSFVDNIMQNLNKRAFNKPINEALMDQKYFNGIGNYLRSEILIRIPNLNPFTKARVAIQEFPEILELCRDIPLLAYKLGGGRLKDWENPFGNEAESARGKSTLFKCYGKKGMAKIKDGNGRTFWFDPKWNKQLQKA